MAERREKIIKVRFSEIELWLIDRQRKHAGGTTRAKYLRERALRALDASRISASDIADRLGRLGIAVNQLGPGSSAGARDLAKEVRELTVAIRQWSEG